MTTIPGTEKAEKGRSWLKASLGNIIMRPYLKNKLKAKRTGKVA
jgi:hypothetical protein